MRGRGDGYRVTGVPPGTRLRCGSLLSRRATCLAPGGSACSPGRPCSHADPAQVEARVEGVQEAHSFAGLAMLSVLGQDDRDLVELGAGPDQAVPQRELVGHGAATA